MERILSPARVRRYFAVGIVLTRIQSIGEEEGGKKLRTNLIEIKGTWRSIADAARTTIHKEEGSNEPSSSWKRKMLLAEHSPIRKLIISWKWYDLPYWNSMHLVRHKHGIEHFVRTQRTDRTGTDRNELLQGALVEHESEANAQAIINISRKRLCRQASRETQQAWKLVLESIREREPELYSVCVPECIYRGWCYEYKPCGYSGTQHYKCELERYRKKEEKNE